MQEVLFVWGGMCILPVLNERPFWVDWCGWSVTIDQIFAKEGLDNMYFWRQVWWLFRKEVAVEWSSRVQTTTMFFFVVLALAVFGLSLQVSPAVQQQMMPGVLWVTLAFGGTLGMSRLYSAELEDNALHGLRSAPIAREAIFFAKHLALLLFLCGCALWAVPLAAFTFQIPMDRLGWTVALIFFLGLWGFAILGTLMSTLLLKARFREALLPLLFLPIALPLLIAGARATGEILGVGGIPHTGFWLRGLAAFDLLFLTTSLWLFGPQLEE
jgi:heme exporter protein B